MVIEWTREELELTGSFLVERNAFTTRNQMLHLDSVIYEKETHSSTEL